MNKLMVITLLTSFSIRAEADEIEPERIEVVGQPFDRPGPWFGDPFVGGGEGSDILNPNPNEELGLGGGFVPLKKKTEAEVASENEANKQKALEAPWFQKSLAEVGKAINDKVSEFLKSFRGSEVVTTRKVETTIRPDGSITIRSECEERVTAIGDDLPFRPCTNLSQEPVEITTPNGTIIKFRIEIKPLNSDGQKIVFIVADEAEFERLMAEIGT